MALKIESLEKMYVTCNHCHTVCSTDDVTDFKDAMTLPPKVMFMCPECENMAHVWFADLPPRLQAKLINKISKEPKGGLNHPMFKTLPPEAWDDQAAYNTMQFI